MPRPNHLSILSDLQHLPSSPGQGKIPYPSLSFYDLASVPRSLVLLMRAHAEHSYQCHIRGVQTHHMLMIRSLLDLEPYQMCLVDDAAENVSSLSLPLPLSSSPSFTQNHLSVPHRTKNHATNHTTHPFLASFSSIQQEPKCTHSRFGVL